MFSCMRKQPPENCTGWVKLSFSDGQFLWGWGHGQPLWELPLKKSVTGCYTILDIWSEPPCSISLSWARGPVSSACSHSLHCACSSLHGPGHGFCTLCKSEHHSYIPYKTGCRGAIREEINFIWWQPVQLRCRGGSENREPSSLWQVDYYPLSSYMVFFTKWFLTLYAGINFAIKYHLRKHLQFRNFYIKIG